MPVATRLCVSFPHTSLAALWADRELTAVVADRRRRVELRCDRMRDWHDGALTEALRRVAPSRLVVTCRAPADGGGGALDAAARWRTREAALAGGVGLVDVDLADARAAPRRWRQLLAARGPGSRIILSVHSPQMPSADRLLALRREVGELGGDVFKIAAPVADAWQTLPLVRLLAAAAPAGAPPVIPVAMGAAGRFLRVLTAKLSPTSPVCFAASDSAQPPVAGGQLSWRSMVARWRFDDIGPTTPVYAVLGMPVGHSWSPRVHNAILAAAGLPGIYVRLPVARAPAAFLAAFAAPLGLAGLSVTSPHKEAMIAACSELDGPARRMGAVNTLVRRDGAWRGSNTDGEAGAACLAARLGDLRGLEIAILGTGGLARALAVALAGRGARCALVSRTPARAARLAAGLGCRALDAAALAAHPGLRAIVNATPVGMRGGPAGTPLAAELLPPGALVHETIYRPALTPLMAAARARGCEVMGGAELFARQAALQARAFFALDVAPALLVALVADAPGR